MISKFMILSTYTTIISVNYLHDKFSNIFRNEKREKDYKFIIFIYE